MNAGTSWYHLGLRGRLFMAFGVVAALTVLASGSAIISYDSLGRSLGAISEKSLPEITRASEVVQGRRRRRRRRTSPARRDGSGRARPRLQGSDRGAPGTQARRSARSPPMTPRKLNKTADRILVNLDRLMQSVAERQTIAAARDALVAEPAQIASEARRKTVADGRRCRVHPDDGPADRGGQQGPGSRSEDAGGAGRQRTDVAAGDPGACARNPT